MRSSCGKNLGIWLKIPAEDVTLRRCVVAPPLKAPAIRENNMRELNSTPRMIHGPDTPHEPAAQARPSPHEPAAQARPGVALCGRFPCLPSAKIGISDSAPGSASKRSTCRSPWATVIIFMATFPFTKVSTGIFRPIIWKIAHDGGAPRRQKAVGRGQSLVPTLRVGTAPRTLRVPIMHWFSRGQYNTDRVHLRSKATSRHPGRIPRILSNLSNRPA